MSELDADNKLLNLCNAVRERWQGQPTIIEETTSAYQEDNCSFKSSFTLGQDIRARSGCTEQLFTQAEAFVATTIANSLPKFRGHFVSLHHLPYKGDPEAGKHLFFDVMTRPRVDFVVDIERSATSSIHVTTRLHQCPNTLDDLQTYVRGWHESSPLLTGLRAHLEATLKCR